MAFLLAIVFAFASNGKVEKKNDLLTGYIFSNNNCVVTPHNCDPSGEHICKIGTQIVYSTKTGTLCSNPQMRL